MAKNFTASLDTPSKIITGLCAPLFLIWPAVLLYVLRTQPDQSYLWLMIVIAVLLPLIFIGCYLLYPKSYTVTNSSLQINRPIGALTIDKKDIKSGEFIPKKDMGVALRMLGNGGIFGYTGYFTTKQLGRMLWYVTYQEKMVLITLTSGKIICVSPDDVTGFVAAMK
jgi:hypothetical protein